VLLFACAYQPPRGQWITLEAERLYLEDTVLAEGGNTSNYRDVCIEARDEVQAQLLVRLPGRVKPLPLYSSERPEPDLSGESNSTGRIQMLITNCQVEVQQWDGGGGGLSFTFYLSFDVKVSVKYGKQVLLMYSMQTFEQVSTDVANPSFEFSFEEPVARTLLLFDGKRLLVPD